MAKNQGIHKVDTAIKNKIVILHDSGKTYREIGEMLGLAAGTVKTHYHFATGQPSYKMPESPYPRYDSPPVIQGDALIIPDAEIPFHHAEFINQILDLADAWGIKTMISAGDLLHFDSLSGWEPNWTVKPNGGLSEKDEKKLIDIALTLPKNHQQKVLDTIVEIGGAIEDHGFSGEMHHARKALNALNSCFDLLIWVLGNHEGRLLRAINSPVEPSELLNMMRLEEGKWKIAPYYYCLLETESGTFRITHPKSAANGTARSLCSQYFQHVIMGHSHKMFFDFDPSGKYYAIQAGHCVDEERLAYCAQRDAKRDSHKLGAVIVRDGYPYLLHEGIDWERMKKM
jgi:hypothetical protein